MRNFYISRVSAGVVGDNPKLNYEGAQIAEQLLKETSDFFTKATQLILTGGTKCIKFNVTGMKT